MPVFLTSLLGLLGKLPGVIGDVFTQNYNLNMAKLELQKQQIIAQAQLATATVTADAQRAEEIVKATGARFKYFTFLLWFGPFIAGVFKPEWSTPIFKNLAGMPDWYVQSCITIMFTIWGISVSAPVISNIFSSLGSFLTTRHGQSVEKALAKNLVDKETFYNALRKVKGVVTNSDVKVDDKVIDQINADSQSANGSPDGSQ
jgi:hypothetical protein